jgi:hypothetical protein
MTAGGAAAEASLSLLLWGPVSITLRSVRILTAWGLLLLLLPALVPTVVLLLTWLLAKGTPASSVARGVTACGW